MLSRNEEIEYERKYKEMKGYVLDSIYLYLLFISIPLDSTLEYLNQLN